MRRGRQIICAFATQMAGSFSEIGKITVCSIYITITNWNKIKSLKFNLKIERIMIEKEKEATARKQK